MNGRAIETRDYKLFPSPRNEHLEVFTHKVFVPYPYDLIDLPSFNLKGKFTLFAACRLSDMKMGQMASFELPEDANKFEADFKPD